MWKLSVANGNSWHCQIFATYTCTLCTHSFVIYTLYAIWVVPLIKLNVSFSTSALFFVNWPRGLKICSPPFLWSYFRHWHTSLWVLQSQGGPCNFRVLFVPLTILQHKLLNKNTGCFLIRKGLQNERNF